ncbi:hypothetical protein [Xylanimonas sp. McL0601]|uniref:hypothetical protein n=1 Tax=Xylanimonas sp. McL0601 TaxID=3414739 RepID=UPI003CF724CC
MTTTDADAVEAVTALRELGAIFHAATGRRHTLWLRVTPSAGVRIVLDPALTPPWTVAHHEGALPPTRLVRCDDLAAALEAADDLVGDILADLLMI